MIIKNGMILPLHSRIYYNYLVSDAPFLSAAWLPSGVGTAGLPKRIELNKELPVAPVALCPHHCDGSQDYQSQATVIGSLQLFFKEKGGDQQHKQHFDLAQCFDQRD